MKRLILFAALMGACRTPTAPTPTMQAFPLRSVAGVAVPWAYTDSLRVHSGVIELEPDSTFRDIQTYDYVFSGRKVTRTDTIKGRYRVVGTLIDFRGGGMFTRGGYDGRTITLAFEHIWIYRR